MKRREFRRAGRALAALAIVVLLCAGTMVTAFAAQEPNAGGAIVSDDETSVTAAITKVFRTGESTDIPNATFTFDLVQDTTVTTDADGGALEVAQDLVPISSITASVTSTMTGTEDTIERVKTVEVQTGDFLASAAYTKAGIYVYKMTETQTGAYTIADSTKESLVYSQAEYTIYVYVANKADGSGVYIKAISSVLTKDDAGLGEGDAGVSPEVGNKVDPTPNTSPPTDGSVSADNSDLKFTNDYLKTNGGGGDPTDPANQSLVIGKTVVGDFGDHTKYFDYAVTVKKPVVSPDTVYKGYVVDETNAVVTSADNLDAADIALLKTDGTNEYIEFVFDSSGVALENIKLKHNQRLVFSDASVGTHFQAIETGVMNYTPTLDVLIDNTTISDPAYTGTVGSGMDTSELVVGEDANSAAFHQYIY